jgi:hypothetical protein
MHHLTLTNALSLLRSQKVAAMPWINDIPFKPEHSAHPDDFLKSPWPFRDFSSTMQPSQRTTPVSSEELRATQARLYVLLVQAQDRLRREQGRPRIIATELSLTDEQANGRPTSGNRSKTNGETNDLAASGDKEPSDEA